MRLSKRMPLLAALRAGGRKRSLLRAMISPKSVRGTMNGWLSRLSDPSEQLSAQSVHFTG